MTLRNELKRASEQFEARNQALTADALVQLARDQAVEFPTLHAHFWEVAESALAHEARLARAHRLIISIRVIIGDATETRMLVHTPGTAGYRPIEDVVRTYDLAALRLRELQADISRARSRLREFQSLLPDAVALQIEENLASAERAAEPRAAALDAVA